MLDGIFDNGKNKFISEIIIPPMPIKKNIYMCGKVFIIEPIEKLFKSYDDYGIILISGELTELYTINNTNYKLIDKISITRQKKQKKGGQSSQRFQRIRLNQINEYINLICLTIDKNYLIKDDGVRSNVKGLIIGGIGNIKDKVFDRLIKHNHLTIKKKLNLNKFNIHDVIMASYDIFQGKDLNKEIKILKKFKEDLSKCDDRLVFGKEVIEYLNNFMLKKIIIHESIELNINYDCQIIKISSLTNEGKIFFDNFNGMVGYKWY